MWGTKGVTDPRLAVYGSYYIGTLDNLDHDGIILATNGVLCR